MKLDSALVALVLLQEETNVRFGWINHAVFPWKSKGQSEQGKNLKDTHKDYKIVCL